MRLRGRGLAVFAAAVVCAAIVLGGAVLLVTSLVGSPTGVDRAPGTPMLYVPAQWNEIRASSGHTSHLAQDPMPCSRCHGRGFARLEATICRDCHGLWRDHAHRSILGQAGVDCLQCHRFGADITVAPAGCLRCHSRAQGFAPAIAGHGNAPCTACHSIHDELATAASTCDDCHPDRPVRHGAPRRGPGSCADCHDAHGGRREASKRCTECHDHLPAQATFAGHDECVTCHRPHRIESSGLEPCASCHAEITTLAGRTVPGHGPCQSCHPAHAPARSPRCASCHRTLAVAHPPALPGQRRRAGNPPAGELATGASGSRGQCLGCHPIHPRGAMSASARRCSWCHDDAASDTAFHAGKARCVECHPPHGRGPDNHSVSDDRPRDNHVINAVACASCHGEAAAASARAKGHERCADCHRDAGHKPGLDPVPCRQCHDAERARAARGHESCSECHRPHDGAVKKGAECQACHRDQRASAPEGHRRCLDCHDAHSGAIARRGQCISCHSAQSLDRHTGVSGGCSACHRAHGPGGPARAPTCISCHGLSTLPALHGIAEHRECHRCHTAHEQAAGRDRATCAAECHRDLGAHEPTAALCTGCHPFRTSRPSRKASQPAPAR